MGRFFGYAFLFLIHCCYGAVPVYEVHEKMDVHKCVVKIIQRIELDEPTDVTLINVNVSLAKELHSLLEHPVRFISRSFYWPNDTLFNDVYIIQSTDFFMFLRGMDLVKRDPFWNPRAKFIIIVEYIDSFLQDVSDFLIYNHIYDVALVVYDQVYTFGLEHDECDRPIARILQLLAHCSEVQNIDKIYAVARKASLRGCHVKFVTHNYWPFMSFNGKHAIEQYILKLIAQHEYITVEVVNFGKVEQFGERLDNFTYTGMLHEIEIYNVEGALGGYILTLNRMTNLDFVYPYMVDHYKIVTARAKVLGKWVAVLKQLGLVTLCIVFATFCIICFIVISTGIFKKRFSDSSRDILIIWGYFLNNITQKKDVKTGIAHRLILLNTLLYVFIISCATQASLLSATTKPIRDNQPDTVEEVISDYQLIVSPNLFAYLKNNPIVIFSNAKKVCKSSLDCMMRVMNENKPIYTISSDIYHKSYIWKFADDRGELKIYTISESVGTLLQTMYIRRGSSLVEPINRLLLRAGSAGLIEFYFEKLHFEERLKYKFHASKGRKPQSLKGLIGVYMLLISGYCISTIAFIIEKWHKPR